MASQVSAHVKAVKVQVRKMLRAGLDTEFIVTKCNVSRALVKDWEEEFLRELLENGSAQRARIRDMLLRNSPQMINILFKMANQEVDTKLQVTAATTFLGFASRFLKEDASIMAAESKISDKGQMIQHTLFDFVLPGEERKKPISGERLAQQESPVSGVFADNEVGPDDLPPLEESLEDGSEDADGEDEDTYPEY